jgi:hypothetical protein
MKDDLLRWLSDIAAHPVVYGIGAAISRWLVGDREGGLVGLISYISASALVAMAAALYLRGEALSESKALFWVLLTAFLAKDILIVLVALGRRAMNDPIGTLREVRAALRGQDVDRDKR